MYAFRQRADTKVLDEPLYAHYLKLSGAERPYRDLVLAAQPQDSAQVIDSILAPRDTKYLYVKHMAKHGMGTGRRLLEGTRHVLLVREPMSVLRSFGEVLSPSLEETCYGALLELHSSLRAAGRAPPVILSEDLVADPEGTLRTLCTALDLPWDPAMLAWPAGPKPEDGVWAPWWYARTHASTGFGREGGEQGREGSSVAPPPRPRLPDHLKPLLEECRVLYSLLRRAALRPASALTLGQPPGTPPGQSAGTPAKGGTHAYAPDPRNADVLIGIRDGVTGVFDLVWRPQARVSVLDSGFMLGDGVWEGIRVHRGRCLFLQAHLDRLWEGAAALALDPGLTRQRLTAMLYATLDANGMAEGVHVRLMLTRGLKSTPYQSPAATVGAPTVVIIAEHKAAASGPATNGIRLVTSHIRRGSPDVQDPAWNSHSKLNCIAACISAAAAGADEALMLDPAGFVATCNSTNFFIVRGGEVWAPTTKYQLHGITRAKVLALCRQHGIPCRETDFSLTTVYSADEAFVTGTFAGQIPVVAVDGRVIGDGRRGPMVQRLQQLYAEMCDAEAAKGREH